MKIVTLRPELKKRIQEWLISFHRLDPRYKILTFFNQVASDGADNLVLGDEDDQYSNDFCGWADDPLPIKTKFTHIEKLLQDAFNTTSILTVWRPCSNDAMRKMMEGSGVGKGLDIKGKSAQKGELSAFVPFMQIHENHDKNQIQPIPSGAKMRVYYPTVEQREEAITQLTVCIPTKDKEGDKEKKKDDEKDENKEEKEDNNIKKEEEDHNEKVIQNYIKCIDRYNHKNWYGIEVSQRIFWDAYVTKQDITRNEDTFTGRPSTPGFQDANNYSLASAMKQIPKPSPMPVVVQYHKTNAMSVQHLVMAYEENGTVTPVVSDFDGFLLGWRREALWFGCNLPRDQEEL